LRLKIENVVVEVIDRLVKLAWRKRRLWHSS
jgi:hypothetical protein